MGSLSADLLAMMRIESVTGNESGLADWFIERFGKAGIRAHPGGPAARGHWIRVGNSVVVQTSVSGPGNGGRPHLILAGHLDTVPLAECPPPSRRGSKLYGRGAADMKSGLAAMLHLIETLEPATTPYRISYVFYAGEEGPADGNDLVRVLEAVPDLATADLALVLEPTDGVLELGCSGSLHLDVVFEGVACHSARPWLGDHPLRRAVPWLQSMLDMPYRSVVMAGVEYREVVSLTIVRCGETRNVLPGEARVNLNLRYPPDRTPEEAEAYAYTLVPENAGQVRARVVDHVPPAGVPEEAPLFRHLLETTQLPRRAKQAWTDVARFWALGVPAVNWGPGDPALAHTRDESIEVEDLVRYADALSHFVRTAPPGTSG